MREIKFRAWNGEKMFYPDIDSCHFIFFSKYGHIPWGLYDNSTGTRLVTGDPEAIFNTPGNLMQFTGLNDKNGKEIYEGDIVRINKCECTGHDDNGSETWIDCEGEVLFEDGMFVFEGHSAGTLPMSAYKDDFEIIGNIYQNPIV